MLSAALDKAPELSWLCARGRPLRPCCRSGLRFQGQHHCGGCGRGESQQATKSVSKVGGERFVRAMGFWETADLEEVYNTERHLLYVACTRARDHLLVTSVDPPSEFLDDLRL